MLCLIRHLLGPMTTGHDILLFGATGSIGCAVLVALKSSGYRVTVVGRTEVDADEFVAADVTSFESLAAAVPERPFAAVISCLASRTGSPADAWAIDHAAHLNILELAKARGIGQFNLLSAICVQRPMLAFQEAKLAFEAELKGSGLTYSIVRPTAYFKSLSGQLDRLRAGKPFLVFGDGELTACKPISDRDLAEYMVRCLTDAGLQNRVLPIGGPGPALTPLEQGHLLADALGREIKVKRVPVGIMTAIIGVLSAVGVVSRRARDKAEFARIGRYYATESMLVFDKAAGRYDADATPETGTDTLAKFYQDLVAGRVTVDRGDHAVF
ncbi:divinylchlorophyllide 8-vinylreductase [Cognatiyoonia sediminum]|uniref:Divinyl chlorophyllide a 8-vinyl-reductase, chloroplastic n=1 Tax=Cognatiyoonia sediminum TaxID=1508389 RepID=A0A1M5QTR3_9RHOB|nr:NAD(P)H-binding protein [Cognatiyoonia sediminum]SHH17348.1 divinylchlorophyllide 8-vinylreductase [Cognatiyoonia sediminum]